MLFTRISCIFRPRHSEFITFLTVFGNNNNFLTKQKNELSPPRSRSRLFPRVAFSTVRIFSSPPFFCFLSSHFCFHPRINNFEFSFNPRGTRNFSTRSFFYRNVSHLFLLFFKPSSTVNSTNQRRLFFSTGVFLIQNSFSLFSRLILKIKKIDLDNKMRIILF